MQGSATGVVGTELRLTPSAADAVTVTVCPPWATLAPPDTGPSPPGRASVPPLPSPPPVGCPLPCVPAPVTQHSARLSGESWRTPPSQAPPVAPGVP